MTSRRRDQRGSAAVEIVLLAPMLGALVLVVIFGGRLALARQTVQAAAANAARAASIARSADDAKRSATRIAEATLSNQGVTCATSSIEVDTSGFQQPPGTPASTSVTIACDVATADLSLPLPGTTRVSANSSSELDVFRSRR
ncbi:MAG TPA: TadE/TadG family type IV pilus assembly protein [Propionicimonas sp.]|jgi:Flp pilus assembly protein TadG